MTRDEWEQVLYANVKDEVEQDRLNQYVLELEGENAKLKEKNEKLTMLVCHLMAAKPRDVTGIMYKGEVLHFDDLLEEVGLRWVDA
jgi:hypothetical protein